VIVATIGDNQQAVLPDGVKSDHATTPMVGIGTKFQASRARDWMARPWGPALWHYSLVGPQSRGFPWDLRG
jgi:hypothetical protein